MKKLCIVLFLVTLLSANLNAQINYSFSATIRTYTPVVGGITPTLINPPDDYEDEGEEGVSYDYSTTPDEGIGDNIPIGFTFNYNGLDYSNINIDANGFATFGNAELAKLLGGNVEQYFINSLA